MKLFVSFLVVLMTLPVSVAIMIFGWGLIPQNWWVIGWGWLFILVCHFISTAIKDS